MAFYYINNIAEAIREFDNFSHPIDNYKSFAWEGLEFYGKQGGYVTQAELSHYGGLRTVVNNDSNINACDE